ncbi:MAG: response regulator [Bacteroidota bacterium]|nr:response regulator [Bacteroidota bacterium]
MIDDAELLEKVKGNGETILVIEDEEVLAEISKISLEMNGYSVVLAKDGVVGIELFKRNPHAIKAVICDLNLPYLDGASTLLAILAIKPEINIIIVSGSVEPEKIPHLPEFAASMYLQKPYRIEMLLKALYAMLAKEPITI